MCGTLKKRPKTQKLSSLSFALGSSKSSCVQHGTIGLPSWSVCIQPWRVTTQVLTIIWLIFDKYVNVDLICSRFRNPYKPPDVLGVSREKFSDSSVSKDTYFTHLRKSMSSAEKVNAKMEQYIAKTTWKTTLLPNKIMPNSLGSATPRVSKFWKFWLQFQTSFFVAQFEIWGMTQCNNCIDLESISSKGSSNR